ncbi:putative ribonuclease H-like domain-containing protein [Tanacetum coccineum]
MQEELLQFKIQKVWTLVDLPYGKKAIGTKWVYINKKDERGIVVRNKARMVAQGYKQEEGIEYDEVFALVTRIEAIRLFLAYASFMNFVVYQIDAKITFLYGTIEEEVYVSQPLGFVDLEFPDKVYKVEKALYGLHQAPRAWYKTLSTYLLDMGFYRDSDYAGASLDRKFTTRGCQFLGSRLISWQCKKQTVVANSTTEAEYIAASHYCGQIQVAVPSAKKPWGSTPSQTRSERVLQKPNEPPLSKGYTSRSRKGRMEHQFELMANIPITPYDSPLPGGYTPGSDEVRLKLQELMTMFIKLSKEVLDLEKEKDAQAVEILRLMK